MKLNESTVAESKLGKYKKEHTGPGEKGGEGMIYSAKVHLKLLPKNIQEILLFPHLRQEVTKVRKKIHCGKMCLVRG